MDTYKKCTNCGADYGLHHFETQQCPHNGVEEWRDGHKQKWDDTIFQPELSDADIFGWLKSKKYQTSQMEQEYRGYYHVDMPKIIRAAIKELGAVAKV